MTIGAVPERMPLWRLSRPRRRGPGWAGGLAVAVSLFSLLPLGFVIWVAVQSGPATIAQLVFRPRVGELLVNTLLLLGLALPVTLALAVALAWLCERTDLPGARFWIWLGVAPLAVPAFVHSYAWVTVWPGLHGLGAAVLVSVLAYSPFAFLPVVAALRRLDPALEEAAAALGEPPLRVFLRVVLPQLRLALLGGALLVALHLLAEYGLFVFLRYDTFTTAIVDQFQSAFNGPAANLMGGVLAAICLAILGLEGLLRGHERYARLGSGAARPARRLALGRARWPLVLVPAVLAALALGVPLLTLARWLAAGGAEVWQVAPISRAVLQTLALAAGGGALTVALALPIAWLGIRRPGPLPRALEACNYITAALPGVVVALALVTVTVRLALPLYQSVATLLAAYALMFLPRALVSLRASLAQAPVELEEAAASLGRPPLVALLQTTARLAAPGAAAGAALVAIGVVTELVGTQMLAPNGTRTLAMAFWAKSGELDYAAAAPYALIMVLLALPLTGILLAQSMRAAGR